MARRAVLSAAVAGVTTRGGNGSPTADPVPLPLYPPGVGFRPGMGGVADNDAVLFALELVLRAATPLERALVGAASVWRQGPEEVADLLGMPVADVRQRAVRLHARLLAAHDTAQATAGQGPAHDALDDNLDAVV